MYWTTGASEPVHSPRAVMGAQAFENLLRRQALMPEDSDREITGAQGVEGCEHFSRASVSTGVCPIRSGCGRANERQCRNTQKNAAA